MIQLLDTDTINKIAAGEVIERPASVVKELVENAIDAGADRISVEIEEGGMSLVRVSDNGSGIPKRDIRNAFIKHATSKITSVDDLNGVATLGFRGEALSSIAAVAEVTLLTKTADSDAGYSYSINAGEEENFEEAGLPEGTTVLVRNLFFNTPVRKKFLKSASAEGAMVGTLMEHMALSCPKVSFTFKNNGKEKLSTGGNGNLKEVVYSVYGREIAGNLIEINEGNDDVKIKGFIGKPAISRGNRSFENYAVNGRYIKNDSVSMAIEEAYKGYIMLHNFPFTALLFEINPDLLDVNVHPAKRELRLTASENVCAFITEVLRKRISGEDIVPDVTPGKEDRQRDGGTEKVNVATSGIAGQAGSVTGMMEVEGDTAVGDLSTFEKADESNIENVKKAIDANLKEKTDYPAEDIQVKKTPLFVKNGMSEYEDSDVSKDLLRQSPIFEGGPSISSGNPEQTRPRRVEEGYLSPSEKKHEEKDKNTKFEQQEIEGVREANKYRLIGQLFATYWLIETGDTFYMMDQHAAHEKILYERLMKNMKEKEPQIQFLTVPVVIECSAESADLLDSDSKLFDTFTRLGYELEPFGDKSLKVTGIPAALPVMDYRQMLTDIIDALADKKEIGINPGDTPQIMIEKIASMSCKAAIKGNDRISETEASGLLSEMMEAENPYNCPHGRPTLIAMTKYEIEKKFKRIV